MNDQIKNKLVNHINEFIDEEKSKIELGLPPSSLEALYGTILTVEASATGVEITTEKSMVTIMGELMEDYDERTPEHIFLFAKAMINSLEEQINRYKDFANLGLHLLEAKIEGLDPKELIKKAEDKARIEAMISSWKEDEDDDDD